MKVLNYLQGNKGYVMFVRKICFIWGKPAKKNDTLTYDFHKTTVLEGKHLKPVIVIYFL